MVTLHADYLETLSVGTHTVSILSKSGAAATEFTIAGGEGNNLALWIALSLVFGSALGIGTYIGMAVYKKKKPANREEQ